MDYKGKEVIRSPKSAQFESYERMLRDELPAGVKRELIGLIEKEMPPMEERIRCQLPEIVRIVHRNLFQVFRKNCTSADSMDIQETLDTEVAENSSDSNINFLDDSFAMEFAASDASLHRCGLTIPSTLFSQTSIFLISCFSLHSQPVLEIFRTLVIIPGNCLPCLNRTKLRMSMTLKGTVALTLDRPRSRPKLKILLLENLLRFIRLALLR
jgi:hypothetical protein